LAGAIVRIDVTMRNVWIRNAMPTKARGGRVGNTRTLRTGKGREYPSLRLMAEN